MWLRPSPGEKRLQIWGELKGLVCHSRPPHLPVLGWCPSVTWLSRGRDGSWVSSLVGVENGGPRNTGPGLERAAWVSFPAQPEPRKAAALEEARPVGNVAAQAVGSSRPLCFLLTILQLCALCEAEGAMWPQARGLSGGTQCGVAAGPPQLPTPPGASALPGNPVDVGTEAKSGDPLSSLTCEMGWFSGPVGV